MKNILLHEPTTRAKMLIKALEIDTLKSYCSEIQHRFIPAVYIQHTILS